MYSKLKSIIYFGIRFGICSKWFPKYMSGISGFWCPSENHAKPNGFQWFSDGAAIPGTCSGSLTRST